MYANRRLSKLETKIQSEKKEEFTRHEDVVSAISEGRKIPWGSTPFLRRLAKVMTEAKESAERRGREQQN